MFSELARDSFREQPLGICMKPCWSQIQDAGIRMDNSHIETVEKRRAIKTIMSHRMCEGLRMLPMSSFFLVAEVREVFETSRMLGSRLDC